MSSNIDSDVSISLCFWASETTLRGLWCLVALSQTVLKAVRNRNAHEDRICRNCCHFRELKEMVIYLVFYMLCVSMGMCMCVQVPVEARKGGWVPWSCEKL